MKHQISHFILVALFAVPFLGSTPAFSQDKGFYAGANFGKSDLKDSCRGAANCDDSDTSLSIFGGYQLNKNFGGEVAYTDLGKASFGSVSVEATGFEFTAVGTMPLNPQFSLYGKLGLFMWDADVKGAAGSDDGIDLTLAIGARWNFARNLAAQLQWQRYQLDSDDVDVIGVGILFRF